MQTNVLTSNVIRAGHGLLFVPLVYAFLIWFCYGFVVNGNFADPQ